jgi:hypothetical protein
MRRSSNWGEGHLGFMSLGHIPQGALGLGIWLCLALSVFCSVGVGYASARKRVTWCMVHGHGAMEVHCWFLVQLELAATIQYAG